MGPVGPTGLGGATGPTGPSVATRARVRASASAVIAPGATRTFTVACDPGEVATGGGFNGGGTMVTAYENRPNPVSATAPPTGWVVSIQNATNTTGTAANRTALAYVVCVPA